MLWDQVASDRSEDITLSCNAMPHKEKLEYLRSFVLGLQTSSNILFAIGTAIKNMSVE